MEKTEIRKALEERANGAGLKINPDLSDDQLEKQVIAAEAGKEKPKTRAKPKPVKRAAKPKSSEGDTITVVGPKKGRWRAGRRFGPEPVTIPLAELAEGDLEALKGDPALVVS